MSFLSRYRIWKIYSRIMKIAFKYIAQIALAGSFISCGGNQNSQVQAAASGNQVMPCPVTEVPKKTLTGYTSYPVSIEGIVNSEVRAKVTGYITDVLIDEGMMVKKGQLLFKLETLSQNQDTEAAIANLNAAQVRVDKLKPLVEFGNN